MYGEFREMINLQKKQEIILLHVRENYSRRKIAKQLGLDVPRSENTSMNTRKKRKTFTGRYGGRHRGINTIYC